MILAEAARRTNSAYSTLHDHAKAGVLKAKWIVMNGKTSIYVTEEDLSEYIRLQDLRFNLTQEIMSRTMLIIDDKLGESVTDKMSDKVNDVFQIKVESAVAYLLRKLKC